MATLILSISEQTDFLICSSLKKTEFKHNLSFNFVPWSEAQIKFPELKVMAIVPKNFVLETNRGSFLLKAYVYKNFILYTAIWKVIKE